MRDPRVSRATAVRLLALLPVLSAGLALACNSDSTAPAPRQRQAGQLNVLRRSASSPPLVQTTASFYAVKGQDRELRLFYQPTGGSGGSGDEFLRLKVPARALDRRPDGSAIADGDSVLITVTADPALIQVDFQPSGLRFSSAEPAELRMRFAEADRDLNGDGRVDGTDDSLRQQLSLWRQERASAPWDQLLTALRLDIDEAEAKVLGFTGYAVAY